MSSWDLYKSRVEVKGGTKRGAALRRELHFIDTKLADNLSYQHVTIDGICQNVAIINSDNLNEKYIYSLPGEDITHGGLVHWMDNYWLVDERDANQTVYTRAKMTQCNHLLRWVDENHVIKEQWCIVEDGTKLGRIHRAVRISLAYWKRYVKRNPLIAGTPLEPYRLQHKHEIWSCATA